MSTYTCWFPKNVIPNICSSSSLFHDRRSVDRKLKRKPNVEQKGKQKQRQVQRLWRSLQRKQRVAVPKQKLRPRANPVPKPRLSSPICLMELHPQRLVRVHPGGQVQWQSRSIALIELRQLRKVCRNLKQWKVQSFSRCPHWKSLTRSGSSMIKVPLFEIKYIKPNVHLFCDFDLWIVVWTHQR